MGRKKKIAQIIAICDELHNDFEEHGNYAGLVRGSQDIPELLGKSNIQQVIAICQDFKDSLGDADDAVLVKIIKRKLKNIEDFTLC